MAKLSFPNTAAGLLSAYAVAAPRDVSIGGQTITVFDGEDFTARNPPLSKDDQDGIAASKDEKLSALQARSPEEVKAWVASDVKTLAQMQDVIATLAIAVSVLARKL